LRASSGSEVRKFEKGAQRLRHKFSLAHQNSFAEQFVVFTMWQPP